MPDETTPGAAVQFAAEPPPGSPRRAPPPSGSPSPTDPCAPTDEAVIATCLSAPWGLAPLPDGQSALVGERTTGRILQVAKGTEPVLVAQIDGVDASGDGGLLGIVLSPSYDEDGLIYAYVTTAEDNRIIRIARGDVPKAIFTGIPKGATAQRRPDRVRRRPQPVRRHRRHRQPGAGRRSRRRWPERCCGWTSSASRPSPTRRPDSPIYASGFTQVTGMCPLDDGTMAALDQRRDARTCCCR